MTTKQDLIKQYGSISAAARAMGNIPRATLMNRLKRGAPLEVKAKGKSLEEFRQTHDKGFIVPQRVRAALETLGDSWLYESEFAKLANVSSSDLAVFRDRFADFIVVVRRDGKRVWAGTKALAKKLRGMVNA